MKEPATAGDQIRPWLSAPSRVERASSTGLRLPVRVIGDQMASQIEADVGARHETVSHEYIGQKCETGGPVGVKTREAWTL